MTESVEDAIVQKRRVLNPSQYRKNSRAQRAEGRKVRRPYSLCEKQHFDCCGICEEDQEALYAEYELALEKGPEVGELFLRGLMRVPPTNFSKLFHAHMGPRLVPSTTQKCVYCSCQESLSLSLDVGSEPHHNHLFKPGKCPEYAKALRQASEFWGKDNIEAKQVQYFLRTKTGFSCQVCHELFANTFDMMKHGHAMNV